MLHQNQVSGISEHLTLIKPYPLPAIGSNWYMTGEIHSREQNTHFFQRQHFYKQHQVETGKKNKQFQQWLIKTKIKIINILNKKIFQYDVDM